jgi:hypothetical protein
VKHIFEEDVASAIAVTAFKADRTLPDRDSGQIFTEAFYGERFDVLIVFENGAVVEDMSIST